MRIATWNINGLRARKEFVEIWLKERQPDLVGFQELKMQDIDFPHEFFESLGYKTFVHGQKSWNGVAILSKAGGKCLAPENQLAICSGADRSDIARSAIRRVLADGDNPMPMRAIHQSSFARRRRML